jgi:hypothetical protein
MDKADRVRTLYLHACLRYVNREHMTNSSVRQRFGIEPQNIATASRLIREAVEAGGIVPYPLFRVARMAWTRSSGGSATSSTGQAFRVSSTVFL